MSPQLIGFWLRLLSVLPGKPGALDLGMILPKATGPIPERRTPTQAIRD
jgi:hypothetical protein